MKFGNYGFQGSHISEVTGSSPVGPTNNFEGLGNSPNPLFCLLEGQKKPDKDREGCKRGRELDKIRFERVEANEEPFH